VVGLWGCLQLPQVSAAGVGVLQQRLGLECHAPSEETILNLPCSPLNRLINAITRNGRFKPPCE
jgi:hypothetical protein